MPDEKALVPLPQPGSPAEPPAKAEKKRIARLKKEASRKVELMKVEITPELAQSFFASLKRGCDRGDPNAMKLAAAALNIVQNEKGVQVNVQQNNMQVVGGNKNRSAESIIRRLEEREFIQESAKKPASDIQDAEFEDAD
jgi:hypothetical protein